MTEGEVFQFGEFGTVYEARKVPWDAYVNET